MKTRNRRDQVESFERLHTLERRELFSASVALDPAGNLSIATPEDGGAVRVVMQDTPSGMVTQVRMNGVKVTLPDLVNRVNVQGGAGNDQIDFRVFGMVRPIPITIQGGAGNDQIDFRAVSTFRSETYVSLSGDEGSDRIGFSSDTRVYANGGAGNDVIIANDELIWEPPHTLSGGDGDDILINRGSYAYLFGGAGDDVMFGGDTGNYFEGGLGTNIMFGGAGDDVFVHYSGGQDKIWGGNGSDGLQIYQILVSTEIYFNAGSGYDYVAANDLSLIFGSKFNLFNFEYSWQLNSGGGKG